MIEPRTIVVKSTRDKYKARSILLIGAAQKALMHAAIDNAPIDPDRPLEGLIREKPKERGLDQNGLYWLRLGEIAEQVWINNRQFNSDAWHEYARRHWMQETITTKTGEIRSKWIEAPSGELTVISTTQLERGCFAEYTTIVEAEGAKLGTQFSANPREGRF